MGRLVLGLGLAVIALTARAAIDDHRGGWRGAAPAREAAAPADASLSAVLRGDPGTRRALDPLDERTRENLAAVPPSGPSLPPPAVVRQLRRP
jgi:hypothetical protein